MKVLRLTFLMLLGVACSSADDTDKSRSETCADCEPSKPGSKKQKDDDDDDDRKSDRPRDAAPDARRRTAPDGGEDLDASLDDADLPDANKLDASVDAHEPDAPCTTRAWFEDLDGDGYGSAITTQACAKPAGFSALGGDCHDGNPNVHPNQTNEYAAPYTTTGGKQSFDYDCNGAEQTSRPLLPSCGSCGPAANGAKCFVATLTTNRPSGLTVEPRCGNGMYFCSNYPAGVYSWELLPSQPPLACR